MIGVHALVYYAFNQLQRLHWESALQVERGCNQGGISKQTHLLCQHQQLTCQVNMLTCYLTNLLLQLYHLKLRHCTKMARERNHILEACWKVWAIWCGFASTLKLAAGVPVDGGTLSNWNLAAEKSRALSSSRVLIFNHRSSSSSTQEKGGGG